MKVTIERSLDDFRGGVETITETGAMKLTVTPGYWLTLRCGDATVELSCEDVINIVNHYLEERHEIYGDAGRDRLNGQ